MTPKKIHSEILTLLMLDLCDYTPMSSEMGRHNLDQLHDVFDNITIPTIKKYKGRVIKKLGDAFLSAFKSPTNALHAAIELQKKFKEYNKNNKLKHPIKIKIALHTGEVVFKKQDIYGDAVNITSRIEKATKPGHIFFSRSLFLAMNKNEIPHVYLGTKRLKGVKRPVKVFRVKYDFEDKLKRKRKIKKLARKWILFILFLILAYFTAKLYFKF